MTKLNKLDLQEFDVDQLLEITANAQKLIVQKQSHRLYDAYESFEKIAAEADSTIEEILEIGKEIEKERSIKYRDPNKSDNTWTGRGRQPKWLTKALKEGKALSDYAV